MDRSDSTPDVRTTYDDAGRQLALGSRPGTLTFAYNDANESESDELQAPTVGPTTQEVSNERGRSPRQNTT